MSQIKDREVLIASSNPEQIDRIRRGLEKIFTSRKESVTWHEATSVFGALQVMGRLEKSLTPLVVMAGFDGQWFEVLGRAQEIAAHEIVTIMMSGNELDAEAAYAYGIHAVSTVFTELEMAHLVSDLLFGDYYDYQPDQHPAEFNQQYDIHTA